MKIHKIAKKIKGKKDILGPIQKWKEDYGYHIYLPKHDLYDQFSSKEDRDWKIKELRKESKNWPKKK
jgi:hypothetical protein